MRQADAAGVAGGGVHIQDKGLAGLELHAAGLELPNAEFRALDVGQDADGAAEFFLDRADHLDARGMVGMAAVGEDQAKHVGASLEEMGEHVRRGAGRPQGRDDFRAPVTAQTFGHLRAFM